MSDQVLTPLVGQSGDSVVRWLAPRTVAQMTSGAVVEVVEAAAYDKLRSAAQRVADAPIATVGQEMERLRALITDGGEHG